MEMEIDRTDLVKGIAEGTDQVGWEAHVLITEAQACAQNFPNLIVAHCRRESNQVVDWVVKAHRIKSLPVN